MLIKCLFSSNLWLSVVIILALVKNPLFVLFKFSDYAAQNLFYFFYTLSVLFAIITSKSDARISPKNGFVVTLSISILVVVGCFFSIAPNYVQESFGPLVIFMLIPFNLIQFVKPQFNLSYVIYISLIIHFVLGLLVSYFFRLSGLGYGADGMLTSYAISIPSAGFLYLGIVCKNSRHSMILIVLSLIGIYLAFMGGSRGSLISIMFGFGIGIFQRKVSNMMFFIFFIILACFYFYADEIVSLLGDSRSFSSLSDGSISNTDDRSKGTWGPTIEAIIQSPLIGWGCFGDRIFTSGHQWAHNLFLEVACDYGLIIGLLFTIFLLRSSFKLCLIEDNKVISTLFIISVPQLLVSNSYLLSINIWIYLGFVLYWHKNKEFFIYDDDKMMIR